MDTIPQDIPQKQCKGECQQWFPATTEFFHRHTISKDGLKSRCKSCRNKEGQIHKREYRKRPEVKEHERASKQAYRSRPEVKEHISAYNKEYSKQHIEEDRIRAKEYHSRPEVKERERIRERERLNRPGALERKRAQRRKSYHRPGVHERALAKNKANQSRPENKARRRTLYHLPENHARKSAQAKARYRKNPAPFLVYARNRHIRKKGIKGTYTAHQIQDLLKRQKHKCYYCHNRLKKSKGRYIYHIEHTFPLSRVVGTDIPANDISYLVLACPTCNLSKHDKFPWEFPEGGRLL